MSSDRSLPPDAPPDRRDTAPDELEPDRSGSTAELDFDRALARWASRPPRTPAATAARRIESRLPARRRLFRPFAGVSHRTAPRGRRHATPRLAFGTTALALTLAIALALVLGLGRAPRRPCTAVALRAGPHRPPATAPRAAEVVPAPGATDDVLVLDLDERTTLYLDLASEDTWSSGSELGGT